MAPSSARNKGPVIWIAVHTMEGVTDADDAAAFFHRSTSSSAHAVADDQKLIEGVVPYDRAAWTLRSGNPISDNLEICAFADMNRTQWLSNVDVTFYNPSLKKTVTARRPYQQLVNTASWIRRRCSARGIPLRKISPSEVAANRSGVIGHIDYTKGKLDGTHWDPGPGFPWDVVMALASGPLPIPHQQRPQEAPMRTLPASPIETTKTVIGNPFVGPKKVKMWIGTGWGATITGEVFANDDTGYRQPTLNPGVINTVSDNPDFFLLDAGMVSIPIEYQCDQDVMVTFALVD